MEVGANKDLVSVVGAEWDWAEFVELLLLFESFICVM